MRYRAIAVHLLLLLAGLAALPLVGPSGWQMLNALLLAFALAQLGFHAHDAAHGQIARNRAGQRRLAFALWNLACGASVAWWREKHMRHHRHPNEAGADPDLYEVFVFRAEDAARRRGLMRWVAGCQAFLLPLLVAATAAYFQWLSLCFLVRRRPRGWRLELAALLVRHTLFLGLVAASLGGAQGLCFLLVHYAAAGLYLGSVFACNHYGLPVLPAGAAAADAEHLFRVTRNVRTGPVGDYLFGGLNYQIEHHLDPCMPRHRLRAAAAQLRAQRRAGGLAYHEAGWAQALAAVFASFHAAGTPARESRHAAP